MKSITKKEKYFSCPVQTKIHDHTSHAYERMGVELEKGAPKNCKWMRCEFCGISFAWEKGKNGKYPKRHYECPKCHSNALFWTKQKDRGPFWALLMLNRMNELMIKECDTPELVDELERFQGVLRVLVQYVRAPYSLCWGEPWLGFLIAAYCPTVSFRKIKGDTPRLKTIWHMLAHLEEFNPADHIKYTMLDRLADSVGDIITYPQPEYSNAMCEAVANTLIGNPAQ